MSVNFSSSVNHIYKTPEKKANNQQLFLNIEVIGEAIGKNRKISFYYLEYGTDLKLRRRKASDGKARQYIINPYQMVAKDGKHYLICNYDKYENVSNYRIDRIQDIEILDEPRKPFETLVGSDGKPLNLDTYMKEHAYMFSGKKTLVTFRITRPLISDVIDLFGSGVRFFNECEKAVDVTVSTETLGTSAFTRAGRPRTNIFRET